MDEHAFDSMRQWRGFSTKDARQIERQFERIATLGLALWGRTPDDLRRQLAADHPVIPSGCSLADLQHLFGQAQSMLSAYLRDHNMRILLDRALKAGVIIEIGAQSFTVLEARYEIARRAIDWLQDRGGSSSARH